MNFLREDLDRCAISNHGVYLFDLPIVDGDAACSPVSDIERLFSPSGTTVNEDISSGCAALFGSKGKICTIRIGNTYGQMVKTIWVSPVDDISALGSLSITFELLVTGRSKTKSDRICFQWTCLTIEKKQTLGLVNPQARDRRSIIGSKLSCACGQQNDDRA